ncbi:MAG: hypothetical protein H6638_07410 [Ardenticatenales bacterium]|nr:hypothetical protein [Ardenticatenales bacterium]
MIQRLAQLLLLLCGLCLVLSPPAVDAQAATADPRVAEIFDALTPQERIGQLLLVTFPGNVVEDESTIARFIDEFRVGGLLLRPSNENYRNEADTPNQIRTLTNALQNRANEASIARASPLLPLFIAIETKSTDPQYANGLPLTGFTQIPEEMAVGAAWDLSLAEGLGSVVGQEMQAVGVNLLLGLSLNVADVSAPLQANQLGTHTFGSNPYWVSQLGAAFVRGARSGSGGRLAVVAGNFPGIGSSDRSPQRAIATVQKPFTLLQSQDFVPFQSVTTMGADGLPTAETVDGLQTSTVRYRFLQGNIRSSTKPLAFDAQSMPTLLADPSFQPWRDGGGLVISSPLGLPALQQFYQEQLGEQTGEFPVRTIARDALNAGNDILLLADYDSDQSWESRLDDIQRLVEFFVAQYDSDSVFQARVNDAVRRIIAKKLAIYDGDLSQATLRLPDPASLVPNPLRSEGSLTVVNDVAQQGATLLYPTPEELAGTIPNPPRREEEIVIVTDARTVRDCDDCEAQNVLDPFALEQQLVQRFGPEGSEELDPQQITSITFGELTQFLNGEGAVTPAGVNIAAALRDATWLLFLTQSQDAELPESLALRRFLAEYTGTTINQRIVVFAFGVPYDLDATEISRLSAYYALYSPQPRFIEAAGLLLFQTLPPMGYSPVSLPSINYTVDARLRPNPSQVVSLCRDDETLPLDQCPAFPDVLDLSGEAAGLAIRTSIIRDLNGNPVPDGTRINFLLVNPNESGQPAPQEVGTQNGVARSTINLARDGPFTIRVEPTEGEPFASTELNITVLGVNAGLVTAVPPTATPTVTPTPTLTPTPSATPTPRRAVATATAQPTVKLGPLTLRVRQADGRFGWWTLWGAMLGVGSVAAVGVATATGSRAALVRQLLNVGIYGFAGYLAYSALYMFGLFPESFNGWGAISLAVLGALVGMTHND